MNKLIVIALLVLSAFACRNYNKGVIAKKELRDKTPPSVRIAEDYDKKSKKYAPKTYNNPKKAAKAREKQAIQHKKKGDRYLKKRHRHLK